MPVTPGRSANIPVSRPTSITSILPGVLLMLTKYTHVQTFRSRRSSASYIVDRVAARSLPTSESPLSWWRTRRPHDLDGLDVKAIRDALLKVNYVDDCDWLSAVTGNAATAIGIALRALPSHGMNNPVIDAAISAVVCCALEGDGAAKAVILSALCRRQRTDPRCRQLVLLWRAVNS